MLKVDFHTHTGDDPIDHVPYTTTELIDRAAALEFNALAVTLHDRQLDIRPLNAYARSRGIVLIPGIERTIQGRHVLLLNFPATAELVQNFEQLRLLKKAHPEGLVIAPHPFFPLTNCLWGLMDRHEALFDAVEVNAFHTARLDFNRRGVKWARAHGKPVVGNSDAHRLHLLGKTFSLVDSEPTAHAICSAVREGRVKYETSPLSLTEATGYFTGITFSGFRSSQATRPAGLHPGETEKGRPSVAQAVATAKRRRARE